MLIGTPGGPIAVKQCVQTYNLLSSPLCLTVYTRDHQEWIRNAMLLVRYFCRLLPCHHDHKTPSSYCVEVLAMVSGFLLFRGSLCLSQCFLVFCTDLYKPSLYLTVSRHLRHGCLPQNHINTSPVQGLPSSPPSYLLASPPLSSSRKRANYETETALSRHQ
jgi:hypothetical protein